MSASFSRAETSPKAVHPGPNEIDATGAHVAGAGVAVAVGKTTRPAQHPPAIASVRRMQRVQSVLPRSGWRVASGLLCLAFLTLGCRPDPAPPPRRRDSNVEAQREVNSDFRVAFDFLRNYESYDAEEAGKRITYHLQRWAANQQPDPDWIEDPLIQRLPQRFAYLQDDHFLGKLQFDSANFDVVILREAIWTHDLADQIKSEKLHDWRLDEWIHGPAFQDRLSIQSSVLAAAKVFDWTVRNIQLKPLPYTAPKEDPDDGPVLVPDEGAMYLPSESLLIGQGDWIARARVANLVARQSGLTSVVLGIDSDSTDASQTPRPWCWAVFLEGQLYLFDFRLGLPIPGKEGHGIATLEMLLDDPSLLRQLDLNADAYGGSVTYPISNEDLERLVVLIDATPESLSQRMKLLERHLTGAQQVVLSVSPSTLAIDLRKSPGVTGVQLWNVPFEIYRFRQDYQTQFRAAMTENKPVPRVPVEMAQMHQSLRLLDQDGRLSEPRRQHLRGVFFTTDDEPGAKSGYLESRVPDSVIDGDINIATLFKQGLISQIPKDNADQERFIQSLRSQMRRIKELASFWLGLIAFEQGEYGVAINYLEKRVLDAFPKGEFAESATYNLARAYEQQGHIQNDTAQLEKARTLLRKQKSAAQAIGNRIRAAR